MDTLAHLYVERNEAHVAYLQKQLEPKHMEEGDSMDIFLIEIENLKEQLIVVYEIILDSSPVQTVLMAYQIFIEVFCVHSHNHDKRQSKHFFTCDELIFMLLQEEWSKQIKSNIHVADQTFIANK